MKVFEDDLSYVALQHTLGKTIHVYIDSSANVFQDDVLVNPEYGGSGWVIKGKSNALKGFGMNSLIADYNMSSEVWELRGILAFFEIIKRLQPNLLNKNQNFHLYCDNQSLVRALKKETYTKIKGISQHEIRLLNEFIDVTSITFKWVKGHNGDLFNTLADRLARRARLFLEEEAPDFYFKRQNFLYTLLTMKGHNPCFDIITGPVPAHLFDRATDPEEIKRQYNARHRTTSAEREAATIIWADTVYVEVKSQTNTNKSIIGAVVHSAFADGYTINFERDSASATAREIAAVSEALELCWSEGHYGPETPISLYGNMKRAQSFVNTINKGKDPDPLQTNSDPILRNAVENLKVIMAGRNARYIDSVVAERLNLRAS